MSPFGTKPSRDKAVNGVVGCVVVAFGRSFGGGCRDRGTDDRFERPPIAARADVGRLFEQIEPAVLGPRGAGGDPALEDGDLFRREGLALTALVRRHFALRDAIDQVAGSRIAGDDDRTAFAAAKGISAGGQVQFAGGLARLMAGEAASDQKRCDLLVEVGFYGLDWFDVVVGNDDVANQDEQCAADGEPYEPGPGGAGGRQGRHGEDQSNDWSRRSEIW